MSEVDSIKERLDKIRSMILGWLEDKTDFPVVIADNSDPRPNGPHTSFKLLTDLNKVGAMDEKVIDKVTGDQVLRGHRTFTIAIEAVGSAVGPDDELDDKIRATDMLHAAHLSLDLETTRQLFDSVSVAILDEGSVTDISQILETETEPRALLELVLGARFDLVDNPGYFDKVQLSGSFDTNCDGDFNHDTGPIDIN